jgi:hypothetical protein
MRVDRLRDSQATRKRPKYSIEIPITPRGHTGHPPFYRRVITPLGARSLATDSPLDKKTQQNKWEAHNFINYKKMSENLAIVRQGLKNSPSCSLRRFSTPIWTTPMAKKSLFSAITPPRTSLGNNNLNLNLRPLLTSILLNPHHFLPTTLLIKAKIRLLIIRHPKVCIFPHQHSLPLTLYNRKPI